MTETLQLVARISVPTFIVSSMLGMGLGLTPHAVLAPLRSPRWVITALLLNFVLSPALAFLLVRLLPLERPYAIGLLLYSLAAGAPFLPKLAEAAHADLQHTAAYLLLLTAGTIVFMPFAVPAFVPGADANFWAVARPLILFMAVPLIFALIARPYLSRVAQPSRALCRLIANVSLLVVLVVFVGLHLATLRNVFGSGAAAISALFVTLMFAAGYALGGPRPEAKAAAGLAAAARNVAAALPTASAQADPKVVVMLLVATLVGLVVMLLVASLLRRRRVDQTVATPPAS